MSSCINIRPPSGPATETSKFGARSPASPSSSCEDPLTPNGYEISAPFGLRHDVHIRYNYAEARFEGIPDNFMEYFAAHGGSGGLGLGGASPGMFSVGSASPLTPPMTTGKPKAKRSRAWSSTSTKEPSAKQQQLPEPVLLNQQFRLHYRQLPRVAVPGYAERLPAVLCMLKQQFFAKKGYLVPHIFRESPNKDHRDQAMHEINHGTFCGATTDVRVLADLLKLWFRELPVPILHEIPCDQMEKLCRMDSPADEIERMLSGLEYVIVLWLADMLVEVAEFQQENHMGVDQLAIVIAPNLVRIQTENPMVAVTTSKAAVEVFRALLRVRAQRRRQLGQERGL
jgi:hypothetical protein